MDIRFAREWEGQAEALWYEFGGGHFAQSCQVLRHAIASVAASVGGEGLGEAFDREGLAAALRDRLGANSRSPELLKVEKATPSSRGLAMKCLRVGYGVAKGDAAFAYPSEVTALRHVAWHADEEYAGQLALDLDALVGRPRPPAEAPRGDGGDAVVEFALACPPDGHTGAGMSRCVGHVTVRALLEDEAPVALSLRTAQRSSWDDPEFERPATLDVRVVDGKHYRPVLAPGCWRPITVAEFVAAAGSGEPWVDSPFALEWGGPHPKGRPYPPPSLTEAAPEREASRAGRDTWVSRCLSRVGDLVSVNGVVYRETPAPRLHVVATTALCLGRRGREAAARQRHEVRIAWSMGDLRMDTMQDGLPGMRAPAFDWFGDGVDRRPDDPDAPYPAFAFSLDEAEVAKDFASHLAHGLGMDVRGSTPVIGHVPRPIPERELERSLMARAGRVALSGHSGAARVASTLGLVLSHRVDIAFREMAEHPPEDRTANGRVATAAAIATGHCVIAATTGRYATAREDDVDEEAAACMAP